MIEHAAPLSMLAFGLLAHVLKKFLEVRQQVSTVTLHQYVMARPYKTALSIVGAVAGYLLIAEPSTPSLVAAFGVGYAADSMLEVVGAKARAATR
ncbi:MAG: hypothetical protein ACQEUY_13300 [Pseudomonadota bacterium]